jgi:hypothetical protein
VGVSPSTVVGDEVRGMLGSDSKSAGGWTAGEVGEVIVPPVEVRLMDGADRSRDMSLAACKLPFKDGDLGRDDDVCICACACVCVCVFSAMEDVSAGAAVLTGALKRSRSDLTEIEGTGCPSSEPRSEVAGVITSDAGFGGTAGAGLR